MPHAIISDVWAKSELAAKLPQQRKVSGWRASEGIGFSRVTCGDIDEVINMMWMGDDEGFLKTVTRVLSDGHF